MRVWDGVVAVMEWAGDIAVRAARAGAFVAAGAAICYLARWLWPSGLTDMPISEISLGMILGAIGSAACWYFGAVAVVVGLYSLTERGLEPL